MSNKRKRSRCKYHVIGQYLHSSYGFVNFCIASDVNGMGDLKDIIYYQYCPMCGYKISEQIKAYQLENTSQDQVIKETRLKERRKKNNNKGTTCRIPKRKIIIPKKVR